MKTMSRLSAAERRQQNVGSRTSAAERRQQLEVTVAPAGAVIYSFIKIIKNYFPKFYYLIQSKPKTNSGNNHLKSLTLKFLQNLAIHAGLLFKNELNFLYKISEVKLWLQSLQINNLTSLMKARSVDDDLHIL